MTDQDPNAFGLPSGNPPPPPSGYPPPQQGSYFPPPAGYPPPPDPYGAQSYGSGYPAPPPAARGGDAGSLGARFGARVIDGILVGIFASLLTALFKSSGSILVTGLFTGLLMFVYFVAFEVTQGRTLGKRLLGLSVRGPGGAPKPDLKQSAIRNAFTLLPIVPFVGGVLGVVAIVVIAMTISSSPTKQGKHDELAGGTQVVKS